MAGLIASLVATALLLAGAAARVPPSVPIVDLLNNPITYLGQEIVVSGKVAVVYSSHVFTLEEPGPFHTGNDAVVLVQDPDANAACGSNVTIRGIVQPFVRDEIASRFDLTGYRASVLNEWESQPVIWARSVRTSEGKELVAQPRNAATTGTSGIIQAAASNELVRNISLVTASVNPGVYVGRKISITGASILHVAGDRSFWISDGGSASTFVVVDAASLAKAAGRDLKAGDIVNIEGVIEAIPKSNGRVVVDSWGRLDPHDAANVQQEKIYVHANQLRLR